MRGAKLNQFRMWMKKGSLNVRELQLNEYYSFSDPKGQPSCKKIVLHVPTWFSRRIIMILSKFLLSTSLCY